MENHFRNFHQIFTFRDPLSQKKQALRNCLYIYEMDKNSEETKLFISIRSTNSLLTIFS